MFKKMMSMKKNVFLIAVLALFSGCGQDYNSSSNDAGQYAPIEGIDSSTASGARLLAAYRVMQSKCFQCHSSWSTYKTNALWVSSGKVVAGNTSASSVYTSLKNNNGNMPPDPYAQLTAEELETITTWIQGI